MDQQQEVKMVSSKQEVCFGDNLKAMVEHVKVFISEDEIKDDTDIFNFCQKLINTEIFKELSKIHKRLDNISAKRSSSKKIRDYGPFSSKVSQDYATEHNIDISLITDRTSNGKIGMTHLRKYLKEKERKNKKKCCGIISNGDGCSRTGITEFNGSYWCKIHLKKEKKDHDRKTQKEKLEKLNFDQIDYESDLSGYSDNEDNENRRESIESAYTTSGASDSESEVDSSDSEHESPEKPEKPIKKKKLLRRKIKRRATLPPNIGTIKEDQEGIFNGEEIDSNLLALLSSEEFN